VATFIALASEPRGDGDPPLRAQSPSVVLERRMQDQLRQRPEGT
jgi:hypothetical protein